MGYQDNSANYRVYDPESKKISVSRNVTFNEMIEKSGTILEHDEEEMTMHDHKFLKKTSSSKRSKKSPMNPTMSLARPRSFWLQATVLSQAQPRPQMNREYER